MKIEQCLEKENDRKFYWRSREKVVFKQLYLSLLVVIKAVLGLVWHQDKRY